MTRANRKNTSKSAARSNGAARSKPAAPSPPASGQTEAEAKMPPARAGFRDRIVGLRRVPAAELRANPKNWRTHPDAQRSALHGLLSEIGYADALLARPGPDGTLELIDGHLRAEITPDQDVPVLVLDLDDREADLLLASLDPLAAMAGTDGERLNALLAELGQTPAEMDALFSKLARDARVAIANSVVQDEVPAPMHCAVTRPGDLWILGPSAGAAAAGEKIAGSAAAREEVAEVAGESREEHEQDGVGRERPDKGRGRRRGRPPVGPHRLLCGDSTNPDDVRRVLDGALAALVATDPPYVVDYTGERPKKDQRNSGKDWSSLYRETQIEDAESFFRGVFAGVLSALAPHAPVYCWHAHRRCGLIQRIWEELGLLDHQQIIWVKPAPVFGRVIWHFRHEPCMVGWRKGSAPAPDSDHRFDSVWEVGWEVGWGVGEMGRGSESRGAGAMNGASATNEVGDEGGGEATSAMAGSGRTASAGESARAVKSRPGDNEHPTQKPVELFVRPMLRHTRTGDLCFEPFSGSGTQIIAAEQIGRRCAAIELEPVFVDVAIRRWQRLTGREAVLEGTGRTWREVAVERGIDIGEIEAAHARPRAKSKASTSVGAAGGGTSGG